MRKIIILSFLTLFSLGAFGVQNFENLKDAAENGDAESQFKVGFVYEKGLAGVEKNLDEAKLFFEKALDNDVKESYSRLGEIENERGNENQAVKYWESGVDAGDGLSRAYLGRHHYKQGNFHNAIRILRESAMSGVPEAQHYLAKIYEEGRVGAKNIVYAHAWFTIAARNEERSQSDKRRLERRMSETQIEASKRIVENFVENHFS